MANTLLNIDDLLDNTLDATPDVPDYVTPPAGDYLLDITEAAIEKYKSKDKGEGLRIKVTHAIASTVEVAEGMPVADGSLFTTTYQATEDGLAYFKKDAKKYLNVPDVNGVSIRDILSSLKDIKAMPARIKVRKTKNDAGQEFENVNVQPMYPQEEQQ